MHKSYIDTLKYLDDKYIETVRLNPIPFTYDDKNSEFLRKITESKKDIVKRIAASLGMECKEIHAEQAQDCKEK